MRANFSSEKLDIVSKEKFLIVVLIKTILQELEYVGPLFDDSLGRAAEAAKQKCRKPALDS